MNVSAELLPIGKLINYGRLSHYFAAVPKSELLIRRERRQDHRARDVFCYMSPFARMLHDLFLCGMRKHQETQLPLSLYYDDQRL